MRELQDLSKKLLSEGTVKVVIGYEAGPRGARAAFITDPAHAERLIFDPRCVQNLVSYLSPRRTLIRQLGKPAIVVKRCDMCAVSGLIRETQLKRQDVVIIGLRCSGVLQDGSSQEPLSAANLADRCLDCTAREPQQVDYLVGEARELPPGAARRRDERIQALLRATPDERFAFWQEEFSRCVRCYACREVCPLCFCERCLMDKSEPQWVESSPHLRGNLAFHLNRALHLAGRCVDCGECERACPAEIPLNLISRRLAQIIEQRFHYQTTDDPQVPAPVGCYRLDDKEEFIR
jgi:ferredoxin